MSEPILKVRDLHVDIHSPRGVIHAVNSVSFDLRQGEFLGIVGESGCGKSTLLRTLIGLLPRTAHITNGDILFKGRNLAALRRPALQSLRGQEISIIFQEPLTALNPVMKVGEQIAEAPRVRLGCSRHEARRRALELMAQVGIPDPERRFHAYAHQLSGGMRQRVLIAIALSAEPDVLLCDEPTTALDVTIQDQILKLLLKISEEKNLSVIYVTHDLAVVAQLCQRLNVMYAGQIVESGSVETVFRQPRHPYTAGLLGSVPDFHAIRETLAPISGSPPDLVSLPDGCPFHPRCRYVQPNCLSGTFPLRALEGDRATACIHHRLLQPAGERGLQ